MVRCWKRSEDRLEEEQSTDGGPDTSHCSHKAFWFSLSTLLLLIIVALGLAGHLGLSQLHSQSLQVVRVTATDEHGAPINQSASVDQQNDLVTLVVTSSANQTSTVLFDARRGLICYKPVDQDGCFLRTMERPDYDNVNSFLRGATHKSWFQLPGNETHRQMEFLGVLAASQVNASSLGEPLQTLCENRSVHWTRRADGPGKQRLVYFCIDICFPSNICVSVCFYYLPE